MDTSGLDVGVVNLTGDPTTWQAGPDPGPRGILFHEVDTETPFCGLVVIDADGGGRLLEVSPATMRSVAL